MKQKYLPIIVITVLVLQPITQSNAANLVELIPGLFNNAGIDGIFIPANFHEAHFTTDSAEQINQLNSNIARSIRPFPVTPSAGGITYSFDAATGNYEQTTDLLGPLISERPQTLGTNKFSIGVAFTYFEYDEFNGIDLNSLSAVGHHQPDTGSFPGAPPNFPSDPDALEQFEFDMINFQFNVDLKYTTLAFFGAYGVNDRLDLSAVIPIVKADMDVNASATLEVAPENTDFPDIHGDFSETDSASDTATGVGDILLGAKYLIINEDKYDVAGLLRLKLETGDEDDFLGTGSTTILPALIASYDVNENVSLNTNLGVDFDLSDSDNHSFVYSLGVQGGNSKVTGAFEVIGRNAFDGDEDIIDAALGLKWRAAENLILSINALTPLNDDGLRSDLIGTVGFEYRN